MTGCKCNLIALPQNAFHVIQSLKYCAGTPQEGIPNVMDSIPQNVL